MAGAASGEGECTAWAGEPRPLPDADHADPVISRWALFRADELAGLAREAEPRSRALAHSLWSHVGCLDGERKDLAAALERTRPVRVARPVLAWLREPAPGPRSQPDDAAARLAEPIALVGLAPPRPDVGEGGPAALARAESARLATQRALRAARFQEALDRVEEARAALPNPRTPALREASARLEVAGATAALALGREPEARERFARALSLDPALELDPVEHAPKVRRLFQNVRGERPAAPGPAPAPRAPAAGNGGAP